MAQTVRIPQVKHVAVESRPTPLVATFGDSIVAINGVAGQPAFLASRGFMAYALMLLSWRCGFSASYGIGGQTTAQFLTRIADVIADPAKIVVTDGGVNDIGQGVPASTTIANLTSIYQQLRDAGKIVVATTVTPSITMSGAAVTNAIAAGVTSFVSNAPASAGDQVVIDAGTANAETVIVASSAGSAAPFTITLSAATTKAHASGALLRNLTKLAALHAVNAWMVRYVRTQYGMRLVDWHSLYADPTTGGPLTAGTLYPPLLYGVTIDGTHPNKDGAALMGKALADALDSLLPPVPSRIGNNTDTTNLIGNGKAVGNTAGLAAGWTLTAQDATPIVATPTKAGRSDGVAGEWQQIKIGPGNTGAVQLLAGDTSGLTFDGTTAYVARIEFECDTDLVPQANPLQAAVTPLRMGVILRAGSTVVNPTSGNGDALQVSSAGDGHATYWLNRGVLATLPFVPPVTATRAQLYVYSTGVDTGTFRVVNAEIRPVGSS